MKMGETIKTVRESAGMTQVEFAKYLGRSQTAISEYEHGVKRPSFGIWKKIIVIAKKRKVKINFESVFLE